MEIIVTDSYEDMSRRAADVIAAQIASNPKSVLGLATGSTPIGLYEQLTIMHREHGLDFSQVETFNLDEYCGIKGTHEQSYRYYMNTHLFDHVNIDKAMTHVPDGSWHDPQEVCDNYEAKIVRAGGIDLQLLGLGHNGHIGFNEPADSFPVRTHVVDLTESTIQANSRLFHSIDEVPHKACTMGVGTIFAAHKVLMVASGADKAQIVKDAFFGPVTPRVPASILQLHHHCTVILDAEAARLCP